MILSVVGGLAVGKVTTECVTLVPPESEFLSVGGHQDPCVTSEY